MKRSRIGQRPSRSFAWLAAVAVILVGLPALASRPETTPEETTRQAASTAPVAALQTHTGQPQVPLLRLSEEDKALVAIREDGRLQVQAIAEQIEGLSDAEQIRTLQRQAMEIKKQTRLRFLRVKVDFARRRGDRATEREALAVIEHIEHPPKPIPSFHTRPTPQQRRQANESGANGGGRP